MFSPSVNAIPPSTTTRSRRRPRPSSSDSVSQPRAKRQRSALADDTFSAPNAQPEMEQVKAAKMSANKLPVPEATRTSLTSRRELSVRGKKARPTERSQKGDGSVILTSNETYTVGRLPAWPDRLQGDTTLKQHGLIDSESGYALTLSHTHALVWPYASNTPSPETFTFTLSDSTAQTNEDVPLGSIVAATAGASEPGLVVVMPHTGKITYWESIASAATLDIIQQHQHGIESLVTGMYSGERVTQILNAETAGFVLVFSTGRIAYMSVRDNQGRPNINVQMLKNSSGTVASGLFGSLRNVLGSASWRSDMIAARAGSSGPPGERRVVTAGLKGRLQSWDLHRGGRNNLVAETDCRDSVLGAWKSDSSMSDIQADSLQILDFTFTPAPIVDFQPGTKTNEDLTRILLLTTLKSKDATHYALLQVVFGFETLEIGMFRHLQSYTSPIRSSAISKPRVYLPDPALVAFVVFDRAVVVVSMAQQADSPEAQLLSENHILPEAFEDVVDLSKDAGVEITGTGMEEPSMNLLVQEDGKSRRHRAKYPAVLLIVKGVGILRIAATDPYKLTSRQAPQLSAKSKLEQAVFYGSQQNNPLNFRGRSEMVFPPDEIGRAALELSQDIISSATSHIPSLPASIDQNLKKRSAALRDLAMHLKLIGASLSRSTRWRLLSDAEKVKAATAVWEKYDALLQRQAPKHEQDLLYMIILYIHEKFRSEPVAEAGELDRIRHWFINDIYRFQIAVPWAYQAVKTSYQEGKKDHAQIMALVSQANDFVIASLGTAYRFRRENLELYGLQAETLENGILMEDYNDLPEFWTSTFFITDNLKKQTDLARSLVNEYWKRAPAEGVPDAKLVDKVRFDLVSLVDICCTSTTERFRWMLAQDDDDIKTAGHVFREAAQITEEVQIEQLAHLGLATQAINIAEKHRVFSTLVKTIVEELETIRQEWEDLELRGATKSTAATQNLRRAAWLSSLFQEYVTKFGPSFAGAMYSYYISRGELFALLNDANGTDEYLTAFLREYQGFAKVAWINEVTREKDFEQAANTLLSYGLDRERDVWSKKVELSIGKLAHAVPSNRSHSAVALSGRVSATLTTAQRQLSLIRVQEHTYSHIQPIINTAIDENAELQLAIEALGDKEEKDRNGHSRLLLEAITSLLGRKTLSALALVDLLTLMSAGKPDKHASELMDGQQFIYALKALRAGVAEGSEFMSLERLIWRRCMLRSDWKAINDTTSKDDAEVQIQLRHTALYRTLRACLKERMFEKPSALKAISPEDALGVFTDDLDNRFVESSAGTRDPLLTDMKAEDDELKHLIDTCRLQKWFEGALDAAKQSVEAELNAETEGGLIMQEVAQELEALEAKIAADSRNAALDLLKSKSKFKPRQKLAGSSGPLRHAVRGP